MDNKPLAVVLVSGGMDSCVTASIAAVKYDLCFLHVNYGQRTQNREEKAYNDICGFFNPVRRLEIDISYLAGIGGSALTDSSIEVPMHPAGRDGEIPVTYVPFRNAHFLSMAVSWAEVLGAEKIFIGAVEEDGSGYPDCREEFYDAFQKAVERGTKPSTSIRIETPLIHMSKGTIVRTGLKLGSPLHLTWSCYGEESDACGICESCRLRLKGFSEAGAADRISYKKREEI